jgi:hypothetical protein
VAGGRDKGIFLVRTTEALKIDSARAECSVSGFPRCLLGAYPFIQDYYFNTPVLLPPCRCFVAFYRELLAIPFGRDSFC